MYFNSTGQLLRQYRWYAELFVHYLPSQVSLEISRCDSYELVDLFVREFKQGTVDGHTRKFTHVSVRIDTGYGLKQMKHVLSSDIKVFQYKSGDMKSLPSSSERIGFALEEVKIDTCNFGRGWGICIEILKRHARKLSSISFKKPRAFRNGLYGLDETELVDFCVSYGSQLVSLDMCENISPLSCRRIVDQCPIVRISLQNKCNFFDQIPVLAQHLRELRLNLQLRSSEFRILDHVNLNPCG